MDKMEKTKKFFETTPFEDVDVNNTEDVETRYRAYKEAENEGLTCMHDLYQLCLIYKASAENGLIDGVPRRPPSNQIRGAIPHPDLHMVLVHLIKYRPYHHFNMKSLLLTLYAQYYGIVGWFDGTMNTDDMIPGLFNKDTGDNNHVMEIFEALIEHDKGLGLFKKYLDMFDEYHQQVIVNNCIGKAEESSNQDIYKYISPMYTKVHRIARKILEGVCRMQASPGIGYDKVVAASRLCRCVIDDHPCTNIALNLCVKFHFFSCGMCKTCLANKGNRHNLVKKYSEMLNVEFTQMYNIVDATRYLIDSVDRLMADAADAPQKEEL